MRVKSWTAVTAGLFLLGLVPGTANAQPQFPQFLPPVNLGFTSFVDGGPPAGPGFYFQQYLQYFGTDTLKDQDGHSVSVPVGSKLVPALDDAHIWISLSQFIYQSDQPILLGGKWGLDVIVPLISIDSDPGPAGLLSDNNEGLGDVLVGPYIQWDPIMGENGPIFMHRIEIQNLIPTGKYDDDRVLNPGSNFYSLNPYWAGTVFPVPRVTASWRLHYLWSAQNDDPNELLSGNADDTQAGHAIHLNFSTAYELVPRQIRVGLNGYYLRQLANTEVNGNGIPNTREQVLGLGPGAVWHISQDDHIFANAFIESQAEQRPEGTRFTLRWTHHF